MRLDATALRQNRRQLLAFEHPSSLLYSLEQDGHRFVVELVGPLWSALARQQPWQALALEQLLSDIEDRAGQTKGLGRLHHCTTLLLDAAQHLVLDLHQIVRIEECAVAKERIGHSLGVRVGGALCAQGLPTALRADVNPLSSMSLKLCAITLEKATIK